MPTAVGSQQAITCQPEHQCFCVLGVRVDVVQIPDVIARMEEWIRHRSGCHFIAVTGMHGVTEAQHDPKFKEILNAAGMVVPDGYPLAWLGRRKGFSHLVRRVYGPELMATFCDQTAPRGHRHFFYGAAEGVAEELARRFSERYPGLVVAGTSVSSDVKLGRSAARGMA